MRPHVQPSSVNEGITPKYIMAVAAVFALGFGGMMLAPRLIGARTAAPAVAVAPPVEPKAVIPTPTPPPAPARPAQRSFSTVETPLGGIETVRTDGTLAALAACRGAVESGKGYDGVTLDKFAKLINGKADALSPAQIKQGCRMITEGDPAAKALQQRR